MNTVVDQEEIEGLRSKLSMLKSPEDITTDRTIAELFSARPVSPVPSCVSMRSDWSKWNPPDFSKEPGPSDTNPRSVSPVPSNVSMRSDWSKWNPPDFSKEPGPTESHEFKSPRPVSPVPSNVSMRSDWSKWNPPDFSKEPGPTDSHIFRNPRPASPVPSNVSMRSDWSKWNPPDFSKEPKPVDSHLEKRAVSPVPSNVSMRSDWSKWNPPDFTHEGDPPTSLTDVPPKTLTTETGLVKDSNFLREHRHSLKRRNERVTEGTDAAGTTTSLKSVYTELYITERQSEELNVLHEARQLETVSKRKTLNETRIKCQDIFKNFTDKDEQKPVRVVLTNGVAGVGKTFSVQKFTLDWAEDLENHNIDLVIPLSFRELNLVRNQRYSLLALLQDFHPTLDKLAPTELPNFRLLFIFDGLDESRLTLDFISSEEVSDVSRETPVNVLLVNLIRGKLLPSALVWITSRPAASNQIPSVCVDRVTEVRGFFMDDQKEEFFRKRFPDERLSTSIISHIHASRVLFSMCQIPVFCWIAATVFEHMFTAGNCYELPRTLTDLYAHFLLVHMTRNKTKYVKGQAQTQNRHPLQLTPADSEALLKLGRLAFEQLHKGNLMFYEEDLETCGLDVMEASVYSGICTKIFKKEECALFAKPVFCFVHLSVQEFLAAVYVFHAYLIRDNGVLRNFLCNTYVADGVLIEEEDDEEAEEGLTDEEDEPYLANFLNRALEISFESKTGHLDLFVRFLHGLCLESNQRLLFGLLGRMEICPDVVEAVLDDLKMMGSEENVDPDRSINVFHCLREMKDHTVHGQAKEPSGSGALSELQCSALAYRLQVSGEVFEVLDLTQYHTSRTGRWRLVPAVRNCKKAILSNCGLSEPHCEIVASALRSHPSHLRLLDVSTTELQQASVELLCAGLQSAHCRLETLRLVQCNLSEVSCASLASALESNPSHLRELNLGDNNDIGDTGVALLCGFLQSLDCKLHTLKLNECLLSEISCVSLASALKLNPSHLRTLDLSINDISETGLNSLSNYLRIPQCQLEVLRLEMCSATWISCATLGSALKMNPSCLRELNLSRTYILDSGVDLVWDVLRSPHCQLETLKLQNCKLSEISCASLASALKSSRAPLKVLDLRGNNTQGLEELQDLLPTVDIKL